MTSILVVGGADTGRAPMTAALLRQLLEARGYRWSVGSAGVLGHDGDPAEVEARDTMAHMGLDISAHQARSLTDDLATQAALLLALDNGTAMVVRARFPNAASRIHNLGELAGRQRDIPDPFRMQIGAWMTYAREIAAMLEAALPRIVAALPPPAAPRPPPAEEPSGGQPSAVVGHPSAERMAAVERIERLLRTVADMPGVVDWAAARSRIEADLGQIAALPHDGDDLVAAYAGLLRAALAITPAAPSPGQLGALRDAAGRLSSSVGQADLNDLSERLGGWAAL